MPDKEDPPPQSCPIDPSSRAAWLEKAQRTGETPPHPLPSSSTPIPLPQQSQPRQTKTRPLSQDREVSTIPRANPTLATTTPNPSSLPSSTTSTTTTTIPATGPGRPSNSEHESAPDASTGNWIYPSERMFFDAMKRKNYAPQATDMASIVPIHNAVNERAWAEIKRWEGRFAWARRANEGCGGPRLHSFSGDAKKMSPRARWNVLWGYKEPFDRHDWVVERCAGGGGNGKGGERSGVEYVIDFYEGRGREGEEYESGKGMLNFYLDVRPKLNSWEGWKMRIADLTGLW